MFSKAMLQAKANGLDDAIPPNRTITSALGKNWNYSDDVSALTPSLKNRLLRLINDDPDMKASLERAKRLPSSLGKWSSRTSTGHCSVANQSNFMTCSCCKFVNVEVVLETRVFGMLAKYFDNSRYDGIAIRRLVPESELGDLNQSPDIMLFTELRNPGYLWCDHVSRYFSRFHWEAVKHECSRLIRAWLDFMIMVNSSAGVIEFFHQKLVKKRLESLSPFNPPRPPNGDFLISRDHEEAMRHSVRERNELFFTVAPYPMHTLNPLPRFQLWNIVDRFTLYSDENGVPASSENNPIVAALLLTPERNRRYINGLREFATLEHLEYLSPVYIDPTESLADARGNSLDYWECDRETVQLCNFALGNEDSPLWIPFIPGETHVVTTKHFWCSDHATVLQLMESLFLASTCDGSCTIEMKLFNDFGELNQLGYFTCDFAVAFLLPSENPHDEFGKSEEFVKQYCAADSIEFKPCFALSDIRPNCIVVYKFDFTHAFDI